MQYKQGFTILELILVMLILGILLALAVPCLKEPYGRYNLEAAAYSIAEDIRLHIQQAINAQNSMATYKIKFDVINERYYLYKNLDILKKVMLPPSVDLYYTNFISHAITFSINGKPYPRGGTITLRDRYSGEYLYVIIANVTGRVRVDTKPPGLGYE